MGSADFTIEALEKWVGVDKAKLAKLQDDYNRMTTKQRAFYTDDWLQNQTDTVYTTLCEKKALIEKWRQQNQLKSKNEEKKWLQIFASFEKSVELQLTTLKQKIAEHDEKTKQLKAEVDANTKTVEAELTKLGYKR